jgi:hypothetical protein
MRQIVLEADFAAAAEPIEWLGNETQRLSL